MELSFIVVIIRSPVSRLRIVMEPKFDFNRSNFSVDRSFQKRMLFKLTKVSADSLSKLTQVEVNSFVESMFSPQE